MSYERIRVTITPLFYEGVYGDIVDVTKDIDISAFVNENIGSIKREIDNGDYDFGVFTFGAITLKCFNDDGLFSAPEDSRTIFKYKRDLARVKVIYVTDNDIENLLFEGLINEDATRDEDLPDDDINTSVVRFRVLSLDSIFRHVKVSGGSIATGVSISDAIKQILNTTEITNILNFDPLKISVQNDVTIDDGDYFSGTSVKDALDELLLAANAILLIDDTNTIIVTPRIESETLHYFFAPHDPLGRGNIIEIKNYNSGLHRCFSAIEINDTEITNDAAISDYGYRQKSQNIDFIQNQDNEKIIATNLINEFSVPRLECEVKALFSDSAGIKLRDQISIDYPFRALPPDGEDYVVTVDTMVIGESKVNKVIGSIKIEPKIRWKVIGIYHNPKALTSQIKLRQIGKSYGEGIA